MDNFIWGTIFGALMLMLFFCILAMGIAWGRELEKKERK